MGMFPRSCSGSLILDPKTQIARRRNPLTPDSELAPKSGHSLLIEKDSSASRA